MIIACETTDKGWRALTQKGEVLDVACRGLVAVPAGQRVKLDGAEMTVPDPQPEIVARYLQHYNGSASLLQLGDAAGALEQIDAAIAIAPTALAKFNRSIVLLHLGRWAEGFAGFEARLELGLGNPLVKQARGLPRWHGENPRGRRLLLVHDAGFGDTIMLLRYVPVLRGAGAEVRLLLPPELQRLGSRLAPLGSVAEADCWAPMMSLLHIARQTPESTPPAAYLYMAVDRELTERWRARLGHGTQRRVGIAWSVGPNCSADDNRPVPLERLVDMIGPDVDLVSVQTQGAEEADRHGIARYRLEDFADCAALIATLDAVVTVDTAALHLAGAIGHPKVTGLLPYAASWRWASPWYPQARLIRQTAPGDWASVAAQFRERMPGGGLIPAIHHVRIAGGLTR